MNNTYLSWKEYSEGKPMPKLLTIQDILKRQVNIEAEMFSKLEPLKTPHYFILKNIKPTNVGLFGLFSRILP